VGAARFERILARKSFAAGPERSNQAKRLPQSHLFTGRPEASPSALPAMADGGPKRPAIELFRGVGGSCGLARRLRKPMARTRKWLGVPGLPGHQFPGALGGIVRRDVAGQSGREPENYTVFQNETLASCATSVCNLKNVVTAPSSSRKKVQKNPRPLGEVIS